MLILKFLVLFTSVFLVIGIEADDVQNNDKRKEDNLQTYLIEPSNEFDADSTTIIPPLVEGEPNVVIVDEKPTTSITNPENPTNIPDKQIENQPEPYGVPYPYYPNYPYYSGQYAPSYTLPQVNAPNYPPPSNVPTAYVPVQTEYEGILVPIQSMIPPPPPPQPQDQKPKPQSISPHRDNKNTPIINKFDLAVILQALLPPSMLQLIVSWANFILNSFTIMAFAGMITSGICSLTPLCTLTLGALPPSFRRNFISKISNEDDSKMTTINRVKRAADMVSRAMDKYETLQKSVATMSKQLSQSKINKKY